MHGPAVLPFWLVFPIALLTMVVVAGHLMALRSGRAHIPASRYRIRSVNGGMMITLVPMLAIAFSVVSPDAQRLFALMWMACIGMIGIVLLLAVIDACNNLRLARRDAMALRDEHRAVLATLRREQTRNDDPDRTETDG